MNKKKNDIPDDLIGFKDFIDYQDEKTTKSTIRESSSNYDLLTFLDRESNRLAKAIELCEEKVSILKNFPHDTSIIIEEETAIIEKRIRLIEQLKRDDSPLTLNLSELLQSHFNF